MAIATTSPTENASLRMSEDTTADIFACSLLLGATMVVAYVTKKKQWVYFPESSAALVLGMIFGALARWLFLDVSFTFRPEIFFFGLLPIIIFNAGYALKKKDFFRNFSSITLLAVVGTLISTLVYGTLVYLLYKWGVVRSLNPQAPLVESLVFGSLISAIDPVATLSIFNDVHAPPLLYNLVFGESLVNDAVSVVLFRTFSSFYYSEFDAASIALAILQFIGISLGSIILGVLVSLLCAWVLRAVDVHSEYSKFEIAFILISAYISYSVAELFHLSGIMSLFFCGICNAHYGYYNTSHATKISSKYAFEALSYMSELFVFAYLGMQVVAVDHVYDWGLLAASLPLCLLSRACNIFPLTFVTDLMGNKTPTSMKIVMWLSGLRGAIAFALAMNMPGRNEALISTTLFIVVITTVVFGGATAPLLHALGMVTTHESHSHSRLDMPLLHGNSMNDLLASTHTVPEARRTIHSSFKWLDRHYLKPLFGGQRTQETHGIRRTSSEAKGASLTTYSGIGFAFSCPAAWAEELPSALEDTAVVRFSAPELTRAGQPQAEVDVLCLSRLGEALAACDATAFLLRHWELLFPELHGGSRPMNLAGPSGAALSSSSTGAEAEPCTEEPLDGGQVQPGSTEEEGVEVIERSDSVGVLKRDKSDSSWPPHSPFVRTRSFRTSPSTPTFVVWAEEVPGEAEGEKVLRYEVVLHPSDLGGQAQDVRHCLLSVARSGSAVHVCRVMSVEAYFMEHREALRDILDSFRSSSMA